MSGSWMVDQTVVAVVGGTLTFVATFVGLLVAYRRGFIWRSRTAGAASQTRWDGVADALGLRLASSRQANLGGVAGRIGEFEVAVGAHGGWEGERTCFVATLPGELARRLTILPRLEHGPAGPGVRFEGAYQFREADGLKAGQRLTPDLAQIFLSFHRDGIPLTLEGGRLSFEVPQVGFDHLVIAHHTNQLVATAHLLHRHLEEVSQAAVRSTVVFGAFDGHARLQTRWANIARRTRLELTRCEESGERLLSGFRGDFELLVSEQPGMEPASEEACTLGVSHAGCDHTTFRIVMPRQAVFGLRIIPTVRGGVSSMRTGDDEFDLLYAVTGDALHNVEPLLGAAVRASFVALGREACPVELHGPFLSCELDVIHCSEEEIVDHLERLYALATTLCRAFEVTERCVAGAPWAFTV